jgi:hypothetical protein
MYVYKVVVLAAAISLYSAIGLCCNGSLKDKKNTFQVCYARGASLSFVAPALHF